MNINHLFSAAIETEIKKQQLRRKPLSLYQPIWYIMSRGGKRLRPSLTLLVYSMYRKDIERIASYAVAVEAFHNFTLMHDDIMDQAPIRRGMATVHKKWNVNTAILSGDVMLVKVYEAFAKLPASKLKDVLVMFNKCATEVCEGQQWDMEFESERKVSERQYIEMIRLKTAVLLGFSMELGAVLAGASKGDRSALREFGINIGIGFQLKDDLLDVYADKRKFGKVVGGDIVSNKKTFLLIKALEKAKGIEKKNLAKWINSTKFDKRKKVNAVTAIYDTLGVADLTEKKINAYYKKGFESLEKIADSPAKEMLVNFTVDLMNRQV